MLRILQVFKSLIGFHKRCICRDSGYSFGEYSSKVKSFKCVSISPGNSYKMIIARCNNCGRYQLFSFNLLVDWEALELDELLNKFRCSNASLEDFKRDLEVALSCSKSWRVGELEEYENGEVKKR